MKKSAVQYSLSVIAVIGVISSTLMLAMPKYDASERLDVIKFNWGVVTHVGDCRDSKHSLRCPVTTTTRTFDDIDITRFHGNMLKAGDTLSLEHHIYPRLQRSLLCRNGTCMSQGGCYDWMPCFDNSKMPIKESS